MVEYLRRDSTINMIAIRPGLLEKTLNKLVTWGTNSGLVSNLSISALSSLFNRPHLQIYQPAVRTRIYVLTVHIYFTLRL